MPHKLSQDNRRLVLSKYKVFHDHATRKAAGHEHLFDDIAQLSRETVQHYTYDVNANINEKPWKRQNLARARAITERVTRSLEQRRNEAGWRSHLENWIFHRFEVEVIWYVDSFKKTQAESLLNQSSPECRARLWRSELEAPAADPQLPFSPLERRRAARQPCRCQRHRNSSERCENGLNDIFEDRLEVGIVHEEEIMCQVQKEKEVPDRIWGLRTTERIDRILKRQRPAGIGSVGDTMTTSPFKGDSSTLLYPFLVLEAKSEKCADSFSDINTQTGFTIRTLLNLQHNFVLSLPDSQQASIQNASLPLVWMISSKGDQWRVSGAYISAGTSGTEYHILDLWDGRLTYIDQALQLLLILDFIFDWARDMYRGAIVDGLSSLVESPSNSLRSDTDVISTREFQKDSIDFRQLAPETETAGFRELESLDVLRFYDKSGLALRDSSFMSHRMIGLHVTGETLDDFLCSVSKNDGEKRSLALELFDSLCASDCWSVTADCLNKLERVWTGFDRESVLFESPQQSFLAFFSVRSYFGTSAVKFTSKTKYDEWVQVHTLSFVAIAADAFNDLRKMLGCSGSVHLPNVSTFSTETVISVFEEIRFAPVRQCLAAAIETRQVSSSYITLGHTSDTLEHNTHIHTSSYHQPILVQTPWAGSRSGGDLPEQTYRKLKPGMREPAENFLRVSNFEGERTYENSGCTFWPGGGLEIGSCQLAVHVSWPQFKRRIGALDRTANCIFLLPSSTHQSNTAGLESNDLMTSTHVLEMQAAAGLKLNEPCIEKLCVNSHLVALQILYQVSGCYFERVCGHQGVTWQQIFREWKLSEDIPRLDIPPEEDQKYYLDNLRRAGSKFGLEKKLLVLIEIFGNALRTLYSSSQPKPRSELTPSSPVLCSCLPPERWRNSKSLPPNGPQLTSAILSIRDERLLSSGAKSYQAQAIDLVPVAGAETMDSEMSDVTVDQDDSKGCSTCGSPSHRHESMDSQDDESMSEDYEETLPEDELVDSNDGELSSTEGQSTGAVSAVSFLVTGRNTQAAIVRWPVDSLIIRMPIPPLKNVNIAQDSVDQHYQLAPIDWNGTYTQVPTLPQLSPQSITNVTSNLPSSVPASVISSVTSSVPSSLPSRRIGISDILNN